jgi:hypothetical protein
MTDTLAHVLSTITEPGVLAISAILVPWRYKVQAAFGGRQATLQGAEA